MAFTSIAKIFDNMLGDIDKHAHTKYALRVGCVKMAAPRHERFNEIREMGYSDIFNLFENLTFSSSDLTFVFPERWMSVIEQQAFMHAMEQHRDFESIKSIDIITSSPLIISSFRRESIRILTWEDDHLHNGEIRAK